MMVTFLAPAILALLLSVNPSTGGSNSLSRSAISAKACAGVQRTSDHDCCLSLAFDPQPSVPLTTNPSAPATKVAGSQAERTVDDVDVR
jgi:hypothetical protein